MINRIFHRFRQPEPAPCVQSDFAEVALPPLPDVPGMISSGEGRYLFWLASEVYTGRGAVVEIGTWLGKSSIHLAAGLRARHPGAKLICIDHFEWAGGANWGQQAGRTHTRGSDFMPDFLENTAAFADIIDARKSKIRDITFDVPEIEVLVLDAPKRLADIATVLQEAAGRVIPGRTMLAWQDFMHAASFEIPACLAAMDRYLEPVHVVGDGSLVAFRVRRRWPARKARAAALAFDTWSVEHARAVWARWEKIIPPRLQPSFHSGLAMLLHDNGHIEEAKRTLASVIDDDACRNRWRKWSKTSLAKRYAPLFDAVPQD